MTDAKASLNWSKTCYAVDLTGDSLIVVRAERTHSGINCSPVSTSSPAFKNDLEKGIPAAACLTTSQSFARELEAPFASLIKAEKVFPTLLDIQLPFALEDCSFCFLDASKTEENTSRTLATAARLSDVEKRLAALGEKGVDPLVLDHEGVALWTQSIKESPPSSQDSNTPRAIVYLGLDRVTLVIGKGTKFISSHNINAQTPAQINRILQSQMGSSHASGVVNIQHPASIHWFWTGPEANDSRLVSSIRSHIKEEWSGPTSTHDRPDMFLARAIATRALTPGPLRCNLRAGKLTHSTVNEKSTKQQLVAAIFFLACGIFLCVANLVATAVVDSKEKQIDKAFLSLRDQLFGDTSLGGLKEERALKKVRMKLDKNSKLLGPFLSAFEPSLVSTVNSMRDIAAKKGLRYDEISLGREKIFVRGTGDSWGDCEALQKLLLKTGYDTTVKQGNALADERIPFTIETRK